MASAATESSPLLPQKSNMSSSSHPKPQRTVTFNSTISSNEPSASSSNKLIPPAPVPGQTQTGSQPVLAALNSKIRRRHSQGAATLPPVPAQKIGPQRTTKTAQKLKILPDLEHGEDGPDEESGRDVYSQYTRIKDPTARRDAARLGKEDRKRLPRVTAYCTANSYKLDEMMLYFKRKNRTKGTAPKLFDECLYTPYNYEFKMEKDGHGHRHREGSYSGGQQRRFSDSVVEVDEHTDRRREDLLESLDEGNNADGDNELNRSRAQDTSAIADDVQPMADLERHPSNPDLDIEVHTPEVFLFSYGTVVIWGMSLQQEHRFLKEIAHFEVEKLSKDDIQTEDFNFYYTREYQARIYNDFISLREKKNYMTKLAISHALSQSVKTSLYEDLVDATIETTKDVPSQIAMTGKVNLTRKEINMQIGELFILRINIHLQGSVLDAPELMWSEPQLDPVYQAVRSYLEMDQRVELLTERLDVIADLLAVLKDQLTHTHGEYLEWIVIVLIAAEIVVAAINIIVDLYAGVD